MVVFRNESAALLVNSICWSMFIYQTIDGHSRRSVMRMINDHQIKIVLYMNLI